MSNLYNRADAKKKPTDPEKLLEYNRQQANIRVKKSQARGKIRNNMGKETVLLMERYENDTTMTRDELIEEFHSIVQKASRDLSRI